MIRRLLVTPLFVCAFLAAVPSRCLAAPPTEAAALLEKLQKHFRAPEREQQQVLRSLRLVVGTEGVPTLDAPQARRWMQSPITPATKDGLLKRMRDELELLRRFAKAETLETRRVGLALALDAANLAREHGDMPLNTAIGIGFLLPGLLDAPEAGKESRFQILSALEEPFSLFEIGPTDDQILPLPDNEVALDFGRLQVALAPTPRDASWPRVRLARRLLRGNGTPTDRDAAFNNAQAREAFDALRSLVPGEGTLIFRYSMPSLAPRLGEKLSNDELFDSAKQFYKSKSPLDESQQQALDALRAISQHSPQDRAELIEETALRCNFAPGERAALDESATNDFEALVEKYAKHWVSPQIYKYVPRPRATIYRGYYVALCELDKALSQNQPNKIRRVADALYKVAYSHDDDPELKDTLQWGYGDFHYNAEFSDFEARIAETFLVDVMPFAGVNPAYEAKYYIQDIEFYTWRFSNVFLRAYPNWSSVRKQRIEAEERALQDAQGRKNEPFMLYLAAKNDHLCDLSRASCDLLARTAINENHHEQITYAMIQALFAQHRYADALLVIDLEWERRGYSLEHHRDYGFYMRDTNAQLQARFASPTLLRPLP